MTTTTGTTANDDISRLTKVMLYVIGQLNVLREQGYVGGGIPLTDKGFEAFLELDASDFEPTDEELTDCLQFLMTADPDKINEAIGEGYGNN